MAGVNVNSYSAVRGCGCRAGDGEDASVHLLSDNSTKYTCRAFECYLVVSDSVSWCSVSYTSSR